MLAFLKAIDDMKIVKQKTDKELEQGGKNVLETS